MRPSVETIEERLHELSERWVNSEGFLKPAGWALRRVVETRVATRKALDAALQLAGLPSGGDVERLHQRIDELERALEREREEAERARERLEADEARILSLEGELSAREQAPEARGELTPEPAEPPKRRARARRSAP